MWLPAFKILKGLFALLGQFTVSSTGAPYEGPYFQTPQGKTFTGTGPTSSSVEIEKIPDHEHDEEFIGEGSTFTAQSPVPTPQNYKTGYFKRYFIHDTRNGKVLEVLKKNYDITKKLLYIKHGEVNWVLEKPVKDIFNQGYNFKGAASRNRENILKLSLQVPNVDEYITDYGKFADIESDVEGYKFEELPPKEQVRIIKKQTPTVQQHPIRKVKPRFKPNKPVPIKTKTNLYTSGGRFKIKGSNQDYKGFYHVHPTKGAMEGAVHTTEPHRQLIPYLLAAENNTTSNTPSGGGYSGGGNNQEFNIPDGDISETSYTSNNNNISNNNYY